MGWTDAHLHEFTIDGRHYGIPPPDDLREEPIQDERKAKLGSLLKKGLSFSYLYDFGDSWNHLIGVKKVETRTNPTEPTLWRMEREPTRQRTAAAYRATRTSSKFTRPSPRSRMHGNFSVGPVRTSIPSSLTAMSPMRRCYDWGGTNGESRLCARDTSGNKLDTDL